MGLPQANKALGQHWLEDVSSLRSMVEAAETKAGDVVLEIGPGTGTLTDELLKTGSEVIALEFDRQCVADLNNKYRGMDSSQIHVQEGDIRSYDLASLPENYKIVANIPYYLTANLLRKLVDDSHKPIVATLLVQKEVAQRVCADPGQLSLIAVFVQLQYEVSLGSVVPAHLFVPPPKVDSQVLVLRRREEPLFPTDETFNRVVKAGFSERRKKLRSSLSSGLGLSKDAVEKLLAAAEVDPNKRAQELSLEDWHRLASACTSLA